MGTPVALLFVEVKDRIEPRLLRGLAYSLSLNRSWDSIPNEAEKLAHERAAILAEEIPARVQGQTYCVYR
jgi:hypothetical protein